MHSTCLCLLPWLRLAIGIIVRSDSMLSGNLHVLDVTQTEYIRQASRLCNPLHTDIAPNRVWSTLTYALCRLPYSRLVVEPSMDSDTCFQTESCCSYCTLSVYKLGSLVDRSGDSILTCPNPPDPPAGPRHTDPHPTLAHFLFSHLFSHT